MLEEGVDFNDDGVEDQACLSRGWTGAPSLLFFDGKKLSPIAEYTFPNSRTLGLEIVAFGDKRSLLACNEFKLGLYTLATNELWSVRFDTPAIDYALCNDGVVVAKRDGVVLKIDPRGKVISRCILPSELRSIAVKDRVLVCSESGVFLLDSELSVVGRAEVDSLAAEPFRDGFVLALTDGTSLLVTTD